MKIVIKNEDREPFIGNGWRIGWRINTKEGKPYDMMWGALRKDEVQLKELIEDCQVRCNNSDKPLEVIDERN